MLVPRLPKAGLNDQVTAVLLLPLIVAVNVWVCDGCKEIEDGVSEAATGALTVRLNCTEFDPPALVAVIVGVKLPVAVGVPLIMPVEDPRVRPAGSAPLVKVQVIGVVPVAVSVCE